MCFGMMVVVGGFVPIIAKNLQIPQNYIYVVTFIAASTCFLYPFTGTLQGLKCFSAFSTVDLISTICKFLVSIALIRCGYELFVHCLVGKMLLAILFGERYVSSINLFYPQDALLFRLHWLPC